jgi:hypothetical protein
MMKNIFLLFLLIFTTTFYSQTKNLDSKNKKENLSEAKIKNIENLLKFKSDSLNKELLYYKVKEDYYSTALSDQGNRFTLILSGILAVFALVSFGAFKYEISNIKKETNQKIKIHKDEINNYKKKLSKTITELKGAKGNLNTSIALYFEKQEKYAQAFIFYIGASIGHGHSYNGKKKSQKVNDDEKKRFKTCITNLNLALKNLKLIENPKDDDSINDSLDSIKKNMDKIYRFENDEVKNLISQIRTLLTKE